MIESRKRLIVMADIFLTVEGNTRTRRKWVLAQRASPGSESVACLEGMFSERGIPLLLSTMRVSPDKSKKRGRRNGSRGVGEAIVPLKRVTIVEGRASGNLNLQGETDDR